MKMMIPTMMLLPNKFEAKQTELEGTRRTRRCPRCCQRVISWQALAVWALAVRAVVADACDTCCEHAGRSAAAGMTWVMAAAVVAFSVVVAAVVAFSVAVRASPVAAAPAMRERAGGSRSMLTQTPVTYTWLLHPYRSDARFQVLAEREHGAWSF